MRTEGGLGQGRRDTRHVARNTLRSSIPFPSPVTCHAPRAIQAVNALRSEGVRVPCSFRSYVRYPSLQRHVSHASHAPPFPLQAVNALRSEGVHVDVKVTWEGGDVERFVKVRGWLALGLVRQAGNGGGRQGEEQRRGGVTSYGAGR